MDKADTALALPVLGRIKKLGVETSVVDITDLGFSFVSRSAILHCIEELQSHVQGCKLEDLHKISDSLAKLARAMAPLLKPNSAQVPEQPRRKSFPPGQAVQFNPATGHAFKPVG